MAISRSSATRTSQERPARFAAAAMLVALLCEPTRSPLRRKQGCNVYWRPHSLTGAWRILRRRCACRGDRKIGEGHDRDARRLRLPGQEASRARQRQSPGGHDQQWHQHDHRDHQRPAPPLFSIHRGLLLKGGASLRGDEGGRFAQGGEGGERTELSSCSPLPPSGCAAAAPLAQRPPQRSVPLALHRPRRELDFEPDGLVQREDNGHARGLDPEVRHLEHRRRRAR
jgi:hypothetical protein